jgi:hypothetical protein
MTVQQQISSAKSFADLWKLLMADEQSPSPTQFLMWTGTYTESQIAKGLTRASIKAKRLRDAGTPMSAFDVLRYAGSVMQNEKLGIQRHEPKAASVA